MKKEVNILTGLKSTRLTIMALLYCLVLFNPTVLFAQWEIGAGGGTSLPITGYREVIKRGMLLQVEGKYRLGKGNSAVGIEIHYARLIRDGIYSDKFQDPRLSIVPIIFFAEQEFNRYGKFRPYLVAGLGLSIFDFHYEITPFEGNTFSNVSFTMSPQMGFRYAVTKRIIPFVEANIVILADGPPIGFPKADKITGYGWIIMGINYRFSK
ncbi:hypothetical protein BH23BAC1_BH23BAC1_19590 [soil metagenome]